MNPEQEKTLKIFSVERDNIMRDLGILRPQLELIRNEIIELTALKEAVIKERQIMEKEINDKKEYVYKLLADVEARIIQMSK